MLDEKPERVACEQTIGVRENQRFRRRPGAHAGRFAWRFCPVVRGTEISPATLRGESRRRFPRCGRKEPSLPIGISTSSRGSSSAKEVAELGFDVGFLVVSRDDDG